MLIFSILPKITDVFYFINLISEYFSRILFNFYLKRFAIYDTIIITMNFFGEIMKKRLLLIAALVFAMILVFASCGDEVENYAVSFDSDGADEYSTYLIPADSLITKPKDPAKYGYRFIGWFNGDAEWKFDTDRVNSPLTLTAKWERITFTVTFDSNGGSDVNAETVFMGDAASYVEPEPPTTGAVLIGWFDENGEEWSFENEILEDMTLTAKWRYYYTVSFKTNGGEDISPVTVLEGGKISLPKAPTKTGYNFIEWRFEGAKWDFDTDTVNASITLYAVWEAVVYNVSFDSCTGEDISSIPAPFGSLITPPTEPEKYGYNFTGWYNGDALWNFDVDLVTSDVTLTAGWKRTTFIVTFDSNGGSAVDEQFVPMGEMASYVEPEPPTSDAVFIGWFYKNDTEWHFEDEILDYMTLTAKWKYRYTVTFDSNGAYTDAPDDQRVLEGETATEPTAPKKYEYTFVGWMIKDSDELWNFTEQTVSADVTLVAVWKPTPRYTVEFISDLTTHDSQSILQNETALAPDVPSRQENYRFDGWYVYDASTDTVGAKWDFATPITEDLFLIASWVEIEIVTVTFILDVGGNTQVHKTLSVYKSSIIEEPESPEIEGYLFRGWNDENGTPWDFGATADKDITLTAKMLKAYTVVFDFGSSVINREDYVVIVGEGERIPKIEDPDPKEPYEFDEWIIDGVERAWDFDSDVVRGNVRLIATYSIFTPVDEW